MKDRNFGKVWQERIDRWKQSGVPVQKFCDDEGFTTASFYKWRRRLSGNGSKPKANVEFVEVTDAEREPLEVVTSSGVVVRVPA